MVKKFVYDKLAYQRRYAKVYEAGADFWEDPIPTEELVEYIYEMNFPRGIKAIEFGCGEGRDSIFLANQGFEVTAVDTASLAVRRASQRAKHEGVSIDFIVGDATDLSSFRSLTYDLAVSVGYLQMIVDEDERHKHLTETHRLLKPRGLYFSCNIGGNTPVQQENLFKEGPKPEDLTPRRIKVGGEQKEILLPIIAAWPKSGGQYRQEFKASGFNVLKVFHRVTRPLGGCWVVIAQRPTQ